MRQIDQRHVTPSSPETGEVYIGGEGVPLPPGIHRITFRLDGFGASASGVELTDVELGMQAVGQSLTVTKTGTSKGTVISDPAGIDCGADCSEVYAGDTPVSLTAIPAAGSTFAGYLGDPDCTDGSVTMDADKSCTAIFNLTNGPDLAGTWLSPTQSCRRIGTTQGCQLRGKAQVRNHGNQKASTASFLQFYLSADNVVDGGDTFLRQVAVGALNPGHAQGKNLSYMLPTGQTASGKYVIAVIDATGLITETDETNNVLIFGPIP